MRPDPEHQLASYVDALRPILSITSHDFQAVDALLAKVARDEDIHEYNDADHYVDFHTKAPLHRYALEEFLALFDVNEPRKTFLVLKDVHHHLHRPEIIARLKSIALKTMYNDDFYVTVFLVNASQVIPPELEKMITVFDIPLPTPSQVEEILDDYVQGFGIALDEETKNELTVSFKGLSDFEIRQILNLAYQQSGIIDRSDKALVLREKEQLIKKSGMLEIVPYSADLEDVGGLNELKTYLRTKARIFENLGEARKFGIDLPKGVLIVGMPGCGKSLTAKATAQLFSVPLLRLDIGKLMGKYVGESEQNLRRAIRTAEAVAPCVLWIDELEKAFAGIGGTGGGSDITTRLFGNFLTWLQEKESSVYVVATSNDISSLPPEFLRKGRFDELFLVDLPNGEERRRIFEIHLKKRRKMTKDVNSIACAKETEGFSGADIEAVVKEVIEAAFIGEDRSVTTEKILATIKATKSISVTLKEKIEELKNAFKKFDFKPANKGGKELLN